MQTERFPRQWFQRMEEGADEEFYKLPRKVVHLDDDAIAALRDFYAAHLQDGWQVLDLMSSWRSHLPKLKRLSVVGLGMNAEEMDENPQLDRHVLHNLNADPTLPFEDNSFDAALCAVSVQYLTRPIEVFHEVGRVLRPGGPFIVSISNRCFPTKAVAVWNGSNDQQHIQLVAGYFQASGAFEEIQAEDHSPEPYVSDPLFIIWGHARKDEG
jgi:SAM-dependent methyltransferase